MFFQKLRKIMYNISMVVAQTSTKQQPAAHSSSSKKIANKQTPAQAQNSRYRTLPSACTGVDSIPIERLLMKILLGVVALIILVAIGLCSQIINSNHASGYSPTYTKVPAFQS